MTTLEIPAAHGEAISERRRMLEQIRAHFQLVMTEDRRHVDAVLKTYGHKPSDYASYEIRQEGENWLLDLQPVPRPEQQRSAPVRMPPSSAVVEQTTNGAPYPSAD